MFARVSTFQGTPEGVEQSLTRAPDVLERAEALAGFKGLYYLVDRESGKAMSVTLWESESDLQASVEAANQIRSEEAAADSSEILAVEHFEVATAELR
jgi:heme-degrading monooxygenase HmoA